MRFEPVDGGAERCQNLTDHEGKAEVQVASVEEEVSRNQTRCGQEENQAAKKW